MQPYDAPAPIDPSRSAGGAKRRVGFLALLAGVILHPRRFFGSFSEVDIRIPDIPFYAVTLGVGWATSIGIQFGESSQSVLVAMAVTFGAAAVTSMLQLFITAGIVHVVARGLGGRADFITTRRAIAYASTPTLFIGVPYAGWLATLWSVVLPILAVAIVHQITRLRAVAAYLSQIVLAVGFAFLLRIWLLEAYSIPSNSMYPTLFMGDHLFVEKAPLRWFAVSPSPPPRGAAMTFEYPDPNPNNERQDFIKRAIALPGDTVEFDSGKPIINGWRVPRCPVGQIAIQVGPGETRETGALFVEFLQGSAYLVVQSQHETYDVQHDPYRVAPGEFYVLGDNRNNSLDSRAFNMGRGGGVPFRNIKGRARWLWFPPARIGIDLAGPPRLPDPADPKLAKALARCLEHAPSLAQSSPPPPPRSDRP